MNNNDYNDNFLKDQHTSICSKFYKSQYNSVDNIQSEIQLKRDLEMSKKIIDNDITYKEDSYSVFSYIEDHVEKNIINISKTVNLPENHYLIKDNILKYDMIGRFFILVNYDPFKNYQENKYIHNILVIIESGKSKIFTYTINDLFFLSKLQNIEIVEEKIDNEFYLKIPLNIFLECYNGFYPKFLSLYHEFNIIFKNVFKNKDIKLEYSGVNLNHNIKNNILQNNHMFTFLTQTTKCNRYIIKNKMQIPCSGLNNFLLIQFADIFVRPLKNISLIDCDIYYKNDMKKIIPLFKVSEDMIKKIDVFGNANYFIPLTHDLTYDEGIKSFFNNPSSNITGLDTTRNIFYITFNFNCKTPQHIHAVITNFQFNTFIYYLGMTGVRFNS